MADSTHTAPQTTHEFQWKEQMKDLQFQLSAKTMEVQRLKETLNARTYIFAQATKSLDGYRASIAAKDVELQTVKESYAHNSAAFEEYKTEAEAYKLALQDSTNKESSRNAVHVTHIRQLEASLHQLEIQYAQTQTDYETYKKRAHQLLQSTPTDNGKLGELEQTVKQLTLEKAEYNLERIEQERQAEFVQQDLLQALERIRTLEWVETRQKTLLESLEKKTHALHVLEQQLEQSQQEMVALKQRPVHWSVPTASPMATVSTSTASTAKVSTADNGPVEERVATFSYQEREALESIMERLENENTQLREALKQKEQMDSNPTPPGKVEEQQQDLYASMSQLLSPFMKKQEEEVDTKQQLKRMGEMLAESDEKVAVLRIQEKLTLRRLDAFDKRQNMIPEYLKNVLLKFMQTENKQPMVPVIAKLLYLDQEETEQLKKSVMM
ncbi:hypothetical protein BDF14DRAFT_1885665 [Spinellus fusiger]|nr:hypothetical protein BDF14DRAFT_1885665 [Spinellus fusiger]